MLNSIRSKTIILFFLLSFGPLLISRLVIYPKVWEAFQEVRIRDLESVGHKQAELISMWMKERKADTAAIAREYLVRSFLKFVPRDKEFQELTSYLRFIKDRYGYTEISIADSSGRIRVSTREDFVGLGVAEFDYFQEATKGNIFITRVHPSVFPIQNEAGEMEKGVPTLFVSSPIRDDGDKTIGVVSLMVDVTALSEEMRRVKLGRTGETYLVDENGYMITDSHFVSTIREMGLVKKRTSLELKLVDPTTGQLTKGVQACLKGEPGYDAGGYPDYRGVKVLGFWHWIPEYNWGLMSEIDEAEAYRDLYELDRALISISFAFILIVAASAVFLGRRFTAPILHLTEVTRSMARGDLSTAVGLRSKDEFGELATAFDTMREELRQDKQKLEELSVTDALTGLYNRRYLQTKLVEEVVRTNRFHRPLSMIFMDVDRFKSYNDSYGHQEGDKVLKGLAEVLLRDTRKKIDIAYRYGGEEFVVVLPETNGEQAVVVAERVLKDFRGLDFTPKGIVEPIHLTFSAGVTSLKAGEESASLLERADHAMYQAKSMGRNRVVKA